MKTSWSVTVYRATDSQAQHTVNVKQKVVTSENVQNYEALAALQFYPTVHITGRFNTHTSSVRIAEIY